MNKISAESDKKELKLSKHLWSFIENLYEDLCKQSDNQNNRFEQLQKNAEITFNIEYFINQQTLKQEIIKRFFFDQNNLQLIIVDFLSKKIDQNTLQSEVRQNLEIIQ